MAAGAVVVASVLGSAGQAVVTHDPAPREAIERDAWSALDEAGLEPDGVRVEFTESSGTGQLDPRPGTFIVTGDDGTQYRFTVTPPE